MKALLNEYGVDPQLVELELTESVLMQNGGEVLHTLKAIKALGVQLVIDDQSLGLLDGTEVDFTREGLNEGFKFNNPNVTATDRWLPNQVPPDHFG